MAAGQFLGDLASGIFQRQRELQQQQETRDFQQQEGLVRMLSGLVDKVEDPSLLMGHIWDTMGIKKQSSGKGLRGFLDAFSGMPNRTMEDQLGTKFRELTGSFMGAPEARGIRQRSQVAQKGLPYPGGYAPPTPGPFMDRAKADQARLDKSIVFRDPRQEELDKIRQRAEAQSVLMQDRLNLQQTFTSRENELKRQHQVALEGYKAEGRRSAQTQQLAANLFVANPARYGYDYSQAAQDAAQRMVSLNDAQLADLLSKPILRGKMGKKIDAEIGAGGERKLTPYQRSQLENETIKNAQSIIDVLGPASKAALEDERAYDILAKELEKFASARGITYSRDAGSFVGDPTKVLIAKALANQSGMLKTATEARDKFRAAQGKAEAEYLKLKDKKFQGFIDIGASWRDPVSISKGRSRQATPPPKATKGGANQGLRVPVEQGQRQGYMPGDIRTIPGFGGKYRVDRIEGNYYVLTPVK